MKPDIQDKIKQVLSQSEYCEKDVIYFLVESYKFLEGKYGKDFKEDKYYSRIKFYRNWACHFIIKRDSSKIFKEIINSVRQEPIGVDDHLIWTDVVEDKIRSCFREYSPQRLHGEIKDFLIEINYKGKFNWESFRVGLYEIVKDTYLSMIDGESEVFRFRCFDVYSGERLKFNDLNLEVNINHNTFHIITNDDIISGERG